MIKTVKLMMVGICISAGPAASDPTDDARYIVQQTVTEDVLSASMGAVADLMVGSIQNEMTKVGEAISDDAARVFAVMLSEQLVQSMMGEMEEDMAIAYVENLSPDALTSYRAFLESPAGQEVSSTMGVMTAEATKIGEQVGERIAMSAVENVIEKIEGGDLPAGTLKTTQAELTNLFSD